tara:strand:- start:70 stop:408 length:339 start_codon:yes stop_codon:yes gene_type:complete
MFENIKIFFENNKVITLVIITIILMFVSNSKTKEPFYGLRPSKCFSCEKDLIRRKGKDWAWQGQVSKCFDCQYDLVKRLGPKYGAKGGNNKTFKINRNIPINKKRCRKYKLP